jgi:sugar phosphate isomerase/epimerase
VGSLDRVGLQLYTVRTLMAEGVERTLEMVAEVGYREVEFAGYFERTPREEETIETAATLGHRYLVLPSLPSEDHDSLDDYRRIGNEMNRIGEVCRASGLRFAYHNHAFEFQRMDGRIPFDVLLEETDPQLVQIELDLFWIIDGGQDPLAYFEAHPGRFHLCHIKDRLADGTMVEVGAGEIDFAAMFAQAENAGLEHYFVEHDQPNDPGASVRESYRHLSRLTW